MKLGRPWAPGRWAAGHVNPHPPWLVAALIGLPVASWVTFGGG